MSLETPEKVFPFLRAASRELDFAHKLAGEQEGEQHNLIGPIRDIIFGLNTAVTALADHIENEC